MSDLYSRMYGSAPARSTEPTTPALRDKLATRVLGGMKAQNSHTFTADINGELVTLPRADYVRVLEDQIKQMRNLVREMDTKHQRMTRNFNKMAETIRRLEQEMQNKIDLR